MPNKKSSSNVTSLELSCSNLVQALEESVSRNLGDGLLLSGGLDTAIIAYLAPNSMKPGCVTVALRDAPAPDIEYARLVADRLKLQHHIHYFGHDELEASIRDTIVVLKSFDPMEIRNSAAIQLALKIAGKLGMKTIMTGDGGDELFAGYSFLFGLTPGQLNIALKKLWVDMRFSAIDLAADLGLKVNVPFLDTQIRNLAMNIDGSLKVKSENGQVWGKWILRKAFENIVPRELLWRVKAPAEVGIGTTTLPAYYNSIITDTEFAIKQQQYLREDSVNIRSKEQLFYYEIYRGSVGLPYSGDNSGKSCPDCHSTVEERATYCRTCGAYPI